MGLCVVSFCFKAVQMLLAKYVSYALPYPRVKYHPYIPRGLLLYKMGLLLTSAHSKKVDLPHLPYYQFSNFLHVRVHKVQLQHLLAPGCIKTKLSLYAKYLVYPEYGHGKLFHMQDFLSFKNNIFLLNCDSLRL